MTKNIYDEIGRPSRRHLGTITKLTEPLRLFLGVDRFWRNTHRSDGSYSVIGNYPPTAEIFFGNNWFLGHPYFRSTQFFHSGYALPELFNSREYEATQGRLRNEGDCFHVFIVIRKYEECFVEYGFATSKPQPGLETTYLNHISSINKFIDYFEENALKIIQEADECRINISDLIGSKYNENPKIPGITMASEKELQFLKTIEKDSKKVNSLLSLSKSERSCLKHYLSGSTAKEIGKKIHRSPRTIETHLENAKGKLGIQTRSEIFEFLIPYRQFL